jgi:hypothetical protein
MRTAIRWRIASTLLALSALLSWSAGATAGSWARSNDLARKFPNFARQKPRLTTIAVVVDVAEFEVEDGEAKWVYVDDCLSLARKLDEAFLTALAKRGYSVKRQPILSVGHAADSTRTCRVFTSWSKRDLRPDSSAAVPPPFYADSTLHPSPGIVSAWREVAHRSLRPRSPKRGAPPLVPGASALRDVVGTDYLLLAVGLGTHNVRYRDAGPGDPALPIGSGIRANGRVAEPTPYPGSRVSMALIDCRDGTVLWADDASDIRPFSEKRMDDIAEDFVAQMP